MDPNRRFLRYSELKPRGVPWSHMHITRLEQKGEFPMHVTFGVRSVAWLESEIDAYVEKKLAARDAA